jgi:hypothetical protein
MAKRTMQGHLQHLRDLAKARKKSDPEAAKALLWAADMLEASQALSAALMTPGAQP